jgi:RAB protein geranylgeranyltransferase component A
MVTLDGKEYKPLADGKYDVIILGSGFKECLLAGLLAAVGGKKVLQPTIRW